jgi:uncharacterized RDD family membrane protein YckC
VTGSARQAYAGIVSRTVAYLVDAMIVAVVAIGGLLVAVLIGTVIGAQGRDFARAVVPICLIGLPAVLAVYNWVFWALAGRTPGMALLGIRVVAASGRPMSWLALLVRAIVLAYFPVGALWALVDRRNQGLHDKLARTTVVRMIEPAPAFRGGGDAVRVAG